MFTTDNLGSWPPAWLTGVEKLAGKVTNISEQARAVTAQLNFRPPAPAPVAALPASPASPVIDETAPVASSSPLKWIVPAAVLSVVAVWFIRRRRA